MLDIETQLIYLDDLFSWTRSNSLRFLYASKFELFDVDGCVDRVERHIAFLKEPFFHKLTPAAETLLVSYNLTRFGISFLKNEGVVYQYGFDALFRPVLIVSPAKFDAAKVIKAWDWHL